MAIRTLEADDLCRHCDPRQFSFETTRDLETSEEIIGQPRAVESVRFGIDIRHEGYNIFCLGEPGTGKRTLVLQYLRRRVAEQEPPSDWCYVNNFQESHKPRALGLPAGRGTELRDDMEQLVEDARGALSGAFESDEYRRRHQALEKEVAQEQQEAFEKLQEKARQRGLAVMRTPQGLALAPLGEDGEPMSPDEANQLPENKREQLQKESQELQQEAQDILQQAPRAQREARREERKLNRDIARNALRPLFEELRETYDGLQKVLAYFDAVEADMVDNAETIVKLHRQMQSDSEGGGEGPQQVQALQAAMQQAAQSAQGSLLRRYQVNVLVGQGLTESDDQAARECRGDDGRGAPLVYEDHPNYPNVIGRVDHRVQMGALLTDFNLIKPGALHRANGGYLVLEAVKLLTQPRVWDALKRALRAECIRIESLGEAMGLARTVQLEPEPIPLDIKVVLMGPPALYRLLRALDPDFAELFKVSADFGTDMDRGDEDCALYARLVATIGKKEFLRPFDREAVAGVIERSSRIAGDSQKLSIHMRSVADLLREADYWAGQDDADVIAGRHVAQAVEAERYRSNRIEKRLQEQIERGTLLIDTEGEHAGQVNGLAIVPLGNYQFGRPTRITARTRMGKGDVVDIEREVALGGPIHSKGVLILSGFLTGRYARSLPLSLTASLVFEQSYSGIGGDSASMAELFALLSAISGLGLKQSLAVTGSVNQHGRAQAIGGVNDKIEGFFDVCTRRGLTGEQGVIIPASNVQHLMLRRDVVEAVSEGSFHLHAIETVDDGMELLTGLDAGQRDEEGNYPPRSVNGKVAAALEEYARQRRKYATTSGKEED